MEIITQGLNQFGFELLRKEYAQNKVGENTVLSNISVFIALLMAMAGSKGETRNEILKSLKIEKYLVQDKLADEEIFLNLHETVHTLIKTVSSNESTNQVILANKMIVNKLKIKTFFDDILKSIYESSVDSVESNETFELIVRNTNKWISDLTNGKITNILDESFKSVSLTLINAIYFNCEWAYEFNREKTQKKDFHVSKTQINQVELMELTNKKFLYHFSESLNSHLLSLPYKNEKYYFNIIFPSNEQDFLLFEDQNSLINKIDYSALKNDFKNQVIESINLIMPKFTIKKKINLNQVLKGLGINLAFDSKKADFNGITDESNLYVQEVLQYSYVEVNEKGTEAAAATVVKIVKRSLSPIIHLNLNRPFVYFISEKSSNGILFLGVFKGGFEAANENRFSKIDKTEL
ncbi:unnamed protein product [Brachionus calyciflorus]|uniref:Serpin domain-containing protein n=1 Tax=Brachionus calyciflorus TaxID=104777 RepID=A0A813MEJ9_9BILA|nr:unnamed protein product [Brachionus calyciflorus]